MRASSLGGIIPSGPAAVNTPPWRALWGSSRLPQFHLRSRQPVGHPHRAIQFGGGGQRGPRLLVSSELAVERAEAAVAVRFQGAHPSLFGEGEGQTVALV